MGLERGRAPTFEAWKGRRRLHFPCLTTVLPMRPKLIHPRISCRIITERVAPVLSDRACKQLFVRPLQKAEPEEFRLFRMLLCIYGRVFQKTWATLSKDRRQRVRNRTSALNAEAEPIGKRAPFDELSERCSQTFGPHILQFRFRLLARLGAERDFRLTKMIRFVHEASIRRASRDSDAKFSRGRTLNTIQQSAAIRQIDLGRRCATIFAAAQTMKMRLICRWLIRFNTTTIGFAHATAPEANPADRSEGESRRNRRARTPQAGGPFAGTPQRRLRV